MYKAILVQWALEKWLIYKHSTFSWSTCTFITKGIWWHNSLKRNFSTSFWGLHETYLIPGFWHNFDDSLCSWQLKVFLDLKNIYISEDWF